MKIVSEQIITDSDAKDILESRSKSSELKYEQKNALETLKKFIKFNPEKIRVLCEELKRVEKLRDRQIAAIANSLPETKDDLRAILHKEYTNFSPEDIDTILEVVRKIV